MKSLILATALAVPFALHAALPGFAAFKDCSMKASKTTSKAKLLKTATVKEAEAKQIALSTAGPGAKIAKGGIETEDGCLVYSYHVRAPGKSGQTEVFVDAGTGAMWMRADDHQLTMPQYVARWTRAGSPGVEYDVEGWPVTDSLALAPISLVLSSGFSIAVRMAPSCSCLSTLPLPASTNTSVWPDLPGALTWYE